MVLVDWDDSELSPRVFRLNEVGALVWDLLDGNTALPELVRRVCEEYDADPQQTEVDVSRFLQRLEEAGVIYLGPPMASKSGARERPC